MNKFKFDWLILPAIGVVIVLALWHSLAGKKVFKLTGDAQELSATIAAHPQAASIDKALIAKLTKGPVTVEQTQKLPADLWTSLTPSFEATRVGIIPDLPNVVETWVSSKPYIMSPWAKRGE